MPKGFAAVIKWVIGLAIVPNNATANIPPPAPQPPVVIYTQQAPPK